VCWTSVVEDNNKMPTFTLTTNVQVPDDFIKPTTALIAKLLGKPESFICVIINDGVKMSFGGKTEPCAVASLSSIGAVGPDKNNDHTKAITTHLVNHLNIPQDRMYVMFADLQRTDVGWNGKTFA